MIQHLLDKKVIFITGKGGTGKTTLAAALAIVAARRRKRVLLAEIDMARPSVEDIFGKSLTYAPKRLAENIDGTNIEFFAATHAYLAESIALDKIVSAILKNKVVRYFLESTPFAREVAFLSTCYFHYQKAITGTGYDLIIVDMPATGHAVPILGVPQNIFRMFRVGPLLKRAKELQGFLSDHRRVAVSLVTLAEDMPVTETLEAYHRLKHDLPLGTGPLFVNKLPLQEFSDPEGEIIRSAIQHLPIGAPERVNALLCAADEVAMHSSRSRIQIARLRQSIQEPVVRITELEEPHTEPAAYRMARALEQTL